MKNPIDLISKKFAKSASIEVKKEVKKTVIDLLPLVLTIAGTVLGIVIFNGSDDSSSDDEATLLPIHSSTTVNNYFFQDLSDDMIMKILDDN